MSKTILIVDDSTALRQVVKLGLVKAGYTVEEASDGKDALGKCPGKSFNLIICDVNMPNMDGLTFVKNLKVQEEHKFTPIIMLTTESGEDRKMEGMSLGVKAWVVKPFQVDKLLSAVEKLII